MFFEKVCMFFKKYICFLKKYVCFLKKYIFFEKAYIFFVRLLLVHRTLTSRAWPEARLHRLIARASKVPCIQSKNSSRGVTANKTGFIT